MNVMQTLTEKLSECKRFFQFVGSHFLEDDCPYRASALAFTTLIAIVPLMALGLSIFSTFPVFQNLAKPLQDFIFANFVPATGKTVQNYLQLFAAQVYKLSTVGIVFLFVVSILVMYTIEAAMNKIWRVSTSRHGIAAFLLYWAIISLAPFLLGLSLAASSYLLSLPILANHDAPVLLSFFPFLCSLIGFTFLYVVVPNCQVRFFHGLMGGFIAAILFESAKVLFAYFLTHYNAYQLLYGAFAAIPVFCVWVYWVWFITLLGAEISYACAMNHQRRLGPALDGFSHALLWLYKLYIAQQKGIDLTLEELIDASELAYSVDVGQMLKQLVQLNFVKHTADEHYVLSRNLKQLTLYDLTRLLPYPLPNSTELSNYKLPFAKEIAKYIKETDEQLQQRLNVSLETLFV